MGTAAIMPTVLGFAVQSLLGGMGGKSDAAPAPAAPVAEAPTPMPTPNDQERKAAERRAMAMQLARRGRASTILTDNPDAKLGG